MDGKIEESKNLIRMIAEQYKNPIIYCSFGKDSMVVLHLCRSMGFNWPVMFHREPEFPIKFRYANRMMEKWNLVCHDYPPNMTSIYEGKDTYEVCTHFKIGAAQDMILCGVLYEPTEFKEGEYLCALNDLYLQPKGRIDFVWDIGLRGCRNADTNPHTGKPLAFRCDIRHNTGGADFAFPIVGWSDEEVYQYIVDNGIPINTDVYEVIDGKLKNKIDKTYNADYRPACFACMRSDNPMTVLCPRKKRPSPMFTTIWLKSWM